MPKPIDPKLMRKLIALKRMKAEGQYIPRKQALAALDVEASQLQAGLEADPVHDAAGPQGSDLQARSRHTRYLVGKLQALAQRRHMAEAELEEARTELRRALASQSLQDDLK